MLRRLLHFFCPSKPWVSSPISVSPATSSAPDHHLELHGYFESTRLKVPVDLQQKPIPWYTYPAIEFLDQFDYSNLKVFEYGCGNSSRWWSQRCQDVTSVEDSAEWHQTVQKNLNGNMTVHFRKETGEYVQCYDAGKKYDLVVIDGNHRMACTQHVLKHSSPMLIILDNSDWFPLCAETLRTAGYQQIDFFGMGPINSYPWCTSIFFKRLDLPLKEGKRPVFTRGGQKLTADHEE